MTPSLAGRCGAMRHILGSLVRYRSKRKVLRVCFAALLAFPVLAQEPSSNLQEQATAASQSGNLPRATDLYKQALAADPHWAQGWWFLGNLQYRQNLYAEATDSLSQYIALSPKAVAALALRGLCEYETGALPASLADIQQALSLGAANQPRNAQILLYHEALLLTRLGRFEEALGKYTPFVQQGLTNDDVAVGLGLAGLRITEQPSALSAADLALAAQSGHAAFQLLGGDVPGGRKAFEALYTAYPGRPNLHYFCGYLLLTSDPDAGIDELRGEIAAVPASQPAHTMLAWMLEVRGDYAEALPVAREAVREDPVLSTNQLVLGRALLENDDARGSLGYLNQVVTREPQNLEAHIDLTKAYSVLGRTEEARQERLLSLQLAEGGRAHAP